MLKRHRHRFADAPPRIRGGPAYRLYQMLAANRRFSTAAGTCTGTRACRSVVQHAEGEQRAEGEELSRVSGGSFLRGDPGPGIEDFQPGGGFSGSGGYRPGKSFGQLKVAPGTGQVGFRHELCGQFGRIFRIPHELLELGRVDFGFTHGFLLYLLLRLYSAGIRIPLWR